MKIAFFTDTYHPQINGVVKSIELFYNHLRKNGNEVHIFCPDGIPKKKYIHPIPSSEFVNYPEYRVGLPTLKIMREIEKINPDVIHVHSPFAVGLYGMYIGKILKIPIVATYHTLIPEYFRYAESNFKKNIASEYTNWFFDKTSVVIVPSNPIKSLLKIKRPIEVLPTPLNLKTIKNNKKESITTIIHVGRLCKEKRIEIILNAFNKIHKKIKSKLIITSDGPERKRLEELCKKLNIEKDVTFTGYVSDKRLLELYSSSNIFVSASNTETQGLVILEAMACGCAVIARNALGFKDFIVDGENGMFFNTEEELVKKVLDVKKNVKLRKKLIRNGYQTLRKYNVSNYVKRMEDIYKESHYKKIDSRTIWKISYATLLLFSSIEFWLLKKMKIPINSKIIDLHIRLFKIFSYFQKLEHFQ